MGERKKERVRMGMGYLVSEVHQILRIEDTPPLGPLLISRAAQFLQPATQYGSVFNLVPS